MPSYRPGTRWCTSCRRNADRTFQGMTEYETPTQRKMVGSVPDKVEFFYDRS